MATKNKTISISISPEIGAVSAECISLPNSKCIMTLAHGAGAGMNHPWMIKIAHLLSEEGVATLRFNFPFTENKKGRPDLPPVAHKTIEAAINQARTLFPDLPVFASGKSFGGRMTSQYLSSHDATDVKGIIFYGFPLHPPGKPSTERAEHLKNVKCPMLFLQGSKDEFATWDLIEPVCSSLKKATLIKIEGANHGFKAGKEDNIKLLSSLTKDWIEKFLE